MPASDTRVTAFDCSTDKEIAPSNAARDSLYVLNDSVSQTLYVRLGPVPATPTDFTVRLLPGDATVVGPNEYVGAVHAVWGAADAVGKVRVTEML